MIENQDEDKEIIDRYNLDNYDEDEEENEQIDGDIPDPYLDRGLEYSDVKIIDFFTIIFYSLNFILG